MEILDVILKSRKGDNMEKLSIVLTNYYIKNQRIPDEKRDIYIYGFKLIFADIINFGIILSLGLFMDKLNEGIVFLITFCHVRQYSGGFHAKTFFVCRLAMMITFISAMLVVAFLKTQIFTIVSVVIANVISVIGISFFAPIENVNKRLSLRIKRINKMKSIIISSGFSLISILLVVFDIKAEGITISVTLFAVFVLMIVGLITTRGGNSSV